MGQASEDSDLLDVPWYQALNATATALGGPETVASLDIAELYAAAGMRDEGNEDLAVLIDSLRREAELSGVGALLARIELLRSLRSRSYLITRPPPEPLSGLADREVVFIVGGPRCGTSILQRWMGEWPQIYSPSTFEVLYPELVGNRDAGTHRLVTIQDRLWDSVDPNFARQHLNRADLPAECLPILCSAFLSPHWSGCYRVPTYERHLSARRIGDAFTFHRLFGELLTAHHAEKWMLFKSPAHAPFLTDLVHAYPRAKIIFIDRDPAAVLGSHARFLGTLRGMRSTRQDPDADMSAAELIISDSYTALCRGLDAASLGEENFRLVAYDSLIETPAKTLEAIGHWLGVGTTRPKINRAELSRLPRRGAKVAIELRERRDQLRHAAHSMTLK